MKISLNSPSKELLKIEPIDSGIEYINKLFYYVDFEESENAKLKFLGGYPRGAVINIIGEADTGKSLLCQTAIVANSVKGMKSVYVSVENPSSYVSMALRRIAFAKKINYQNILNNVKILDISGNYGLANNIDNFFKEFYQVAKGFDICVFDSVSGLYENREVMARYIVRRIFQISKNLKLTCFLISQKREESPFSSRSAGGLAISHIADCNIILSKIIISSPIERKIYNSEIGDVVRIFRIDGCRLCGHSSKNHFFKINEFGLIVFSPKKNNSKDE
ncbi:MAG: KaiC domain-containing protein [bacterium]